jgi:hypothetical protein
MLALFIGSAGAFILCLLLRTSPRSNRFAVFLFSWLVLGLLELILVMPWTAARYLLILLPPVCWFFRRWVEETGSYRLWRMAWAATALMGATLASADFSQAGVIQSFSQILEAQREQFQRLAPQPPRQWFYLGDTFSGAPPYVTPLGWKTVFPFQDIPRGSLLIRARFRTSSWWNLPEPQRFEAVTAWEFESRNPFRVLDIPASAGFYASVWGSLPYVWTDHPLERFELSRVR